MKRVLVSTASKHGATAEIAEEIGRTLRETLQERGGSGDDVVEVHPVEEVSSVDNYDAVVLGSAVYAGHWLEGARGACRASGSCAGCPADLAVF